MTRHEGKSPSQPALITDPLRENFSFAKAVKASSDLPEGKERTANLQPEIDGLFDRFVILGKMCEGAERLLEALDRFPVGRPCASLRRRGHVRRDDRPARPAA